MRNTTSPGRQPAPPAGFGQRVISLMTAHDWLALYLVVGLGYIWYWVAWRLANGDSWDTPWYLAAGNAILDGSFSIYRNVFQDGSPWGYNYPPFVALITAAVTWLAAPFQLDTVNLQRWVAIPYIPFDVLVAYEVSRAVRRLRPASPAILRFTGFCLFLLTPAIPQSSAVIGHFETAAVYPVLLGLRRLPVQPGRAGVLIALGFLFKQTLVVLLFGIGVLLLREAWQSRSPRAPLRFGLGFGGVVGAIWLPFLLVSPESTYRALFEIERLRPIAGFGLWLLVDRAVQHVADPGAHAAIQAGLRAWSHAVLLAVTAGVAVAVGFKCRPLRTGEHADHYGLMALSSLPMLVLMRWSAVHYGVAFLVFFLLWQQAARRTLLPFALYIILAGQVDAFLLTAVWPSATTVKQLLLFAAAFGYILWGMGAAGWWPGRQSAHAPWWSRLLPALPRRRATPVPDPGARLSLPDV